MEDLPRIWVDWNDCQERDVIDLYLPSTKADIEKLGLVMKEGLKIRLYGDELEADAIIIQYENNQHKIYRAKVIEGTMIDVPIS